MDAFMRSAFHGDDFPWTIDEVRSDGCVITCPVNEWQSRPGGTVSGPALMGFADGAAYVAILGAIGPAALAVTTNLNINFLRRPKMAPVRVEADVLKLGRTLGVVETTLFTVGDDRPIAHATITYSMALLDRGGPTDHADVPSTTTPNRSSE